MIQEETFNLKFVAIHDLYQMKKKLITINYEVFNE